MKKILLITVAVGVSAAAAYGQSLPVSIAIRGGGVLAQDSELQATENTWIGAGLDLGLGKGLFPDSNSYFSFDWFRRPNDNDNVYLFHLNQRFYGGFTNNSEQRIYLIGGLGFAKFDIGSADGTVFSSRAGVGMEFTKNLYGEAILTLSAKGEGGFRTNAFGFYLGFKL